MNALISHAIADAVIGQRVSDGYVNATAMCKASGKQFNDYRRTATTGEFLAELSPVTGIPVTGLVVTIQGGTPELQGTWVHPDVAVNLGQWCSPKFAVAVAKWVREWKSGKSRLPYHVERYMANYERIPHTHFSMLNEIIFAIVGPLEQKGYILPDHMLPDISTGMMFCKYLREVHGIDTAALATYRHVYADGRIVEAKLYPNEVLGPFRKYLHETWIPQRAVGYFSERDPAALGLLRAAMPSLACTVISDTSAIGATGAKETT